MNISVPDALAEEVRRREVPVSAICQQALRDEVARLREAEALATPASESAVQAVISAIEHNGGHVDREWAELIAAAALGAENATGG